MTVNLFGQWESYPGNQSYSLALPDFHSTYLSYTVNINDIQDMGLRVTGSFPGARYMSFNVYATTQGTSLSALTDYQITTPDRSQDNPFVAGSSAGPGGTYIVNVQPNVKDAPDLQNLLSFNPDELMDGLLTVILRYYLPSGGDYGDVSAPLIQIYPLLNPDSVKDAPPGVVTDMDSPVHKATFMHRLAPIFQTVSGDRLRFYHVAGGGQFNNADNAYLIAAVADVDGVNNCIALRVKPPSFPQTSEQLDQTMVRYWSFNQGNPDTSTPYGMADIQFNLGSDGFVYIVFGSESVKATADKSGFNYMPWEADSSQAVILYRNLLTVPQYRNSIERVTKLPPPAQFGPPWSESVLVDHEASVYLGDYAPTAYVEPVVQFNNTPYKIFSR